MISNHVIDHADEYRDVAQARRNRGLHTGKSAAGWDWKRPDPEKGSFERERQAVVARWQFEAWEASESYLRDVFPERFETLEF